MEYSIRKLSRLSNVTSRALRWYDKIGLLKPCRVTKSGYRYYSPAEVDRLLDILFFRAAGMELACIKECLDDPFFDRLTVLRSHLTTLKTKQMQLDRLIQSLQDTIKAAEENEPVSDEKKFEAFKRDAVHYWAGP